MVVGLVVDSVDLWFGELVVSVEGLLEGVVVWVDVGFVFVDFICLLELVNMIVIVVDLGECIVFWEVINVVVVDMVEVYLLWGELVEIECGVYVGVFFVGLIYFEYVVVD